jgi:anti-sigma regulatory factor (Ser/Thr protein kinase)
VSNSIFVKEFHSSIEALGDTLNGALAKLIERGWITREQIFYAQLCLEEALVNAVTHGNHCDERLSVRIEVAEEDDICVIRVYDQGSGFNPETVSLPGCENMNGRGICLIRYCMDEVKYDKHEHCLEMRMHRKALCKEGAPHE